MEEQNCLIIFKMLIGIVQLVSRTVKIALHHQNYLIRWNEIFILLPFQELITKYFPQYQMLQK